MTDWADRDDWEDSLGQEMAERELIAQEQAQAESWDETGR